MLVLTIRSREPSLVSLTKIWTNWDLLVLQDYMMRYKWGLMGFTLIRLLDPIAPLAQGAGVGAEIELTKISFLFDRAQPNAKLYFHGWLSRGQWRWFESQGHMRLALIAYFPPFVDTHFPLKFSRLVTIVSSIFHGARVHAAMADGETSEMIRPDFPTVRAKKIIKLHGEIKSINWTRKRYFWWLAQLSNFWSS